MDSQLFELAEMLAELHKKKKDRIIASEDRNIDS